MTGTEAARKLFRHWHNFDHESEGVCEIPDPVPIEDLKILGHVDRMDYISDKDVEEKGEREEFYYYHDYEDSEPQKIARDPDGEWHILGKVKVRTKGRDVSVGLDSWEGKQSFKIPKPPEAVAKLGKLAMIEWVDEMGQRHQHRFRGKMLCAHPDGQHLYVGKVIRKNPYIAPGEYGGNCGDLTVVGHEDGGTIRYGGEDWRFDEEGDNTGHGTKLAEYYGRKCIGSEKENPEWHIQTVEAPEAERHIQRFEKEGYVLEGMRELPGNKVEITMVWHSAVNPLYAKGVIPRSVEKKLPGMVKQMKSQYGPRWREVFYSTLRGMEFTPSVERRLTRPRAENPQGRCYGCGAFVRFKRDPFTELWTCPKCGHQWGSKSDWDRRGNPKKKILNFIVTAPHAIIPNPHDYDYVAAGVAQGVADGLQADLFRADRQRDDGDLNRPATRRSLWRKSVLRKITNSTVLLDIHSFPEDDREWAGDDITLFTIKKAPDREFSRKLARELRAQGLTTTLRRTDHTETLDIITTGKKAGAYRVVLIEVNERFKGAERDIAARIVEAVRKSL